MSDPKGFNPIGQAEVPIEIIANEKEICGENRLGKWLNQDEELKHMQDIFDVYILRTITPSCQVCGNHVTYKAKELCLQYKR